MANFNQKGRNCFTEDEEEFDEEEIWAAASTETGDCNGHYKTPVFPSSSSSLLRPQSSPWKIPEASSEPELSQRSSAPVNIPDWSKIYGKSKKAGIGSWVDEDHHHSGSGSRKVQNFDDDNGSDDDEVIPPHEWIAKKQKGAKISSSVYEGIGRTLKGRDLSKLRNAILTKTGFLE